MGQHESTVDKVLRVLRAHFGEAIELKTLIDEAKFDPSTAPRAVRDITQAAIGVLRKKGFRIVITPPSEQDKDATVQLLTEPGP